MISSKPKCKRKCVPKIHRYVIKGISKSILVCKHCNIKITDEYYNGNFIEAFSHALAAAHTTRDEYVVFKLDDEPTKWRYTEASVYFDLIEDYKGFSKGEKSKVSDYINVNHL